MIKKIQIFIGSIIISLMLNFFIFVALKFWQSGEWNLPFIFFSFMVTLYLVYKMLLNSELAKSDNDMPLESRIKIKRTELIVEGFLYSVMFLLPFSLIITVESFSLGAILILFGAGIAIFLKIRKAIKRKYNVIQELSNTRS